VARKPPSIFVSEKYVETANGFAVGEGATRALAWFEQGVFEAIKSFTEQHAILPAKIKLAQEDVCGRTWMEKNGGLVEVDV